jgi:hypothetical protein
MVSLMTLIIGCRARVLLRVWILPVFLKFFGENLENGVVAIATPVPSMSMVGGSMVVPRLRDWAPGADNFTSPATRKFDAVLGDAVERGCPRADLRPQKAPLSPPRSMFEPGHFRQPTPVQRAEDKPASQSSVPTPQTPGASNGCGGFGSRIVEIVENEATKLLEGKVILADELIIRLLRIR